jgi:hypothetical protein
VHEKTPGPDSSARRRKRLRIIGTVVLLLGLGSAGLVYWLGIRSQDASDDPALLGYNKAQSRQMGVLYGKMGQVIEDLTDDLKRPGTQAALITAASILVASGFFYFAQAPENDGGKR